MSLSNHLALSIPETAERLGVSYRTVWRLCRDGRLPAFQVGSHWRIDALRLERMFERSTSND